MAVRPSVRPSVLLGFKVLLMDTPAFVFSIDKHSSNQSPYSSGIEIVVGLRFIILLVYKYTHHFVGLSSHFFSI